MYTEKGLGGREGLLSAVEVTGPIMLIRRVALTNR
jgi:hypothetical protein